MTDLDVTHLDVTGVDETGGEPACTADEARELVRQARESLVTFDNAMQEIVRRRAWEPLGYPSPREFVLAELGPGEGDDQTGRVSRVHAYRLARVVMFLFGLAERLGGDVDELDVTERALRAIPAGSSSTPNDQIIMDRVESRIEQIGGDVSQEDAQRILDEELARAKTEIAETGALSVDVAVDEPNWAQEDDDVDQLQEHPTPGAAPPPGQASHDRTDDEEHDGEFEDGGDFEGGESRSIASRSGLRNAYRSESATGEAIENAGAFTQMLAGLSVIAEIAPRLPQIVESATDEELEQLVQTSAAAIDACRIINEAAEDLQ